jgi:hypothetical protein
MLPSLRKAAVKAEIAARRPTIKFNPLDLIFSKKKQSVQEIAEEEYTPVTRVGRKVVQRPLPSPNVLPIKIIPSARSFI